MPFTKKTWEDRLVEFAGRRKLTDATTQAVQTVDVTRDEGNVSREGTAFSASNMNDLEQRIADCVSAMETTFQGGVDTLYNKCVSCGWTPTGKTPTAISNAIQGIYGNRYTEGYNNGVSATKKGNATASQVLDGRTFTNSSSVGIEGTMPNRGALNWSASNTTKTVSAGYYSGGTLDSRPSYTAGYNAGKAAASIQFIEVSGSQSSFSKYPDGGLERSVSINTPSTPSGKSLKGVYIKSIYISNTNKTFGSGTFEVLNSGGKYYVISRDCQWPSGGTSVNATVVFVYG